MISVRGVIVVVKVGGRTVPVGVELQSGMVISVPEMTTSELILFTSIKSALGIENWKAMLSSVSFGWTT